jgi:hypothetical protein
MKFSAVGNAAQNNLQQVTGQTNGDGSRSAHVTLAGNTAGSTIAVVSGAPSSQSATIALGESLSPAVDLANQRAVRIAMPAAWTTANLTFQVSVDGVTYNNLYDKDGVEYVVQAAVSRSILLPIVDWLGVRYLKVRSGTSGTPVVQVAARILMLQTVAA